MSTKICLRSGQCCSGYLAFVPKTYESDLSPSVVNSLPDTEVDDYLEKHIEPMGKPCKWLVRDELTTEAACKVHTRKSSQCLDYPEHLAGSKYCNAGLAYWQHRKSANLPVPSWIASVLAVSGC
jgi:hypothetical protein